MPNLTRAQKTITALALGSAFLGFTRRRLGAVKEITR